MGCRLTESFENYLEEKGEIIAKGIDNIQTNLGLIKQHGLYLVSWKCTFSITKEFPSTTFINECCQQLIRFSRLSQRSQLVSILELDFDREGFFDSLTMAEISKQIWGEVTRAL